MKKFALNIPINGLSFGQTSILILRTYLDNIEEYSKIAELDAIFPIGNRDLSAYEPADANRLNAEIDKYLLRGMEGHSRANPAFKLWHLNGSIESYSDNTLLLTFYELDKPTKTELNIARNNKVSFSCRYTQDIFKSYGVDSVYIPLAFDDYSFKRTEKKYVDDGRIVFNVLGKFEKRKNHQKMITAWYKRFGRNPKFFLQCSIFNPFIQPNPEQQYQAIISQLQGGQKIFNSEYFGHIVQNRGYNDLLNSAHIVLGMSAGESWGLPEFQSVALGKHAVIMNAHGYKDWANDENAVLVNPSGKISSVDNFFFHKDAPFNQGEMFDFNEDEFIAGCETAIKRVEKDPVNHEGLKLQKEFSKERFVRTILENI